MDNVRFEDFDYTYDVGRSLWSERRVANLAFAG